MNIIKFTSIILFLLAPILVQAQTEIQHIAPPFWWADMATGELQLMIHGEGIADYHEVTVDHEAVRVMRTFRQDSPNYLFVDLELSARQATTFALTLIKPSTGVSFQYKYELKGRQRATDRIQGLAPSDLIYLIMPDRFANGDESNDVVEGMNQTTLYRDSMFHRHGGDLQGIINHLDYLQKLGVTAIWLNPVLTNDQPEASYHGYAATDHYEIDPRFGGTDKYLEFVNECHKRGMKVVMDIIHNHTGDRHWFIQDPPSKDWVHQHESFTRTHYRAPTLFDPYADPEERRLMREGWFDTHMPDLNQDNPFLAKYLIQNNIWWIEYAGIDGFRMDTYAYSDEGFLEEWSKAIFKEYPQFGAYGETWVHGVATQAYFHGNTNLNKTFNGGMPALTDFQLYYAINAMLNEPFGWTEGVAKVYYTLAKDYLYKAPYRNVIFLDNHDLSRFYSVAGEDIRKYKIGIGFLLTTRGTPCIYYGTEILMKNFAGLHGGEAREDFPGGWKGDSINKFDPANLNDTEKEAFNFVKTLANFRKNNSVLSAGKLMQYIPKDGIYVYFRYDDTKTVMVAINTNDKKVDISLAPYRFTKDVQTATDILTGSRLPLKESLSLDNFEIKILAFER